MVVNIKDRLDRINLFVLMIVVIYTIFVEKVILKTPIINPYADAIIVFLTSVGFYKLLINFIFLLIDRFEFFMKIYWGRLYVNGLWSYTYTIDGSDEQDNNIYFGVWRFEQSIYDTKVLGFGLSEDFIARSRVRSVTDMIHSGGMYEIVNIRSDSIDSSKEVYSLTTMFFELNPKSIFRYPTSMRGKTIIYGGPRNGYVCNNIFTKHESAGTEGDVVEELKMKFGASI